MADVEKVKFGRDWNVNNREEYEAALETLKGNDFVAEMSDCWAVTCTEKAEVARQRKELQIQAYQKGIINWNEF